MNHMKPEFFLSTTTQSITSALKKKSNYPQTSQQSIENKMTTQISTKPVWCYLQLLRVNCQEKAFQVIYADLH